MRHHNPLRAALFSALLPGMGHAYLGYVALGLVLATAHLSIISMILWGEFASLLDVWGLLGLAGAFWAGSVYSAYFQCRSDAAKLLILSGDCAQDELSKALRQACQERQNIKVFCVGSASCVWDSFGPQVGSRLKQLGHGNVYGSADAPLDSSNLVEQMSNIEPNDFVVVVDAGITERAKEVGQIIIRRDGINPGLGLGKDLPRLGDFSIVFNSRRLSDINNPLELDADQEQQRCCQVADMVACALDGVLVEQIRRNDSPTGESLKGVRLGLS